VTLEAVSGRAAKVTRAHCHRAILQPGMVVYVDEIHTPNKGLAFKMRCPACKRYFQTSEPQALLKSRGGIYHPVAWLRLATDAELTRGE
jgi:hypothetical protein